MGESLRRYLDIKVHPDIDSLNWERIRVVGVHDRMPPSIISHKEKRDKPFNWQRPTARRFENGDELRIQCFPGWDHIRHQAAVIATYLRILYGPGMADRVTYTLSPPDETSRTLRQSTNLARLPIADTVVVGLVHRLGRLTGGAKWEGGGPEDVFGWVVRKFGERRVAFLGCRVSFWGDISGCLVRELALRGTREVLYVGKLGTLRPEVRPNRFLATGNSSTLEGAPVHWNNVLAGALGDAPVLTGHHETLPSVLYETKEWLANVPTHHDFVDPEVGCMAQASLDAGIGFGYLHIISDNVAEKYTEDLSNERINGVLRGRDALYQHIQDVLMRHLNADAHSPSVPILHM